MCIRDSPSSSSVRSPSRSRVEGPLLLVVVVVALVDSVMEGVMVCKDDGDEKDEETGMSPPPKADMCISISSVVSSTAS